MHFLNIYSIVFWDFFSILTRGHYEYHIAIQEEKCRNGLTIFVAARKWLGRRKITKLKGWLDDYVKTFSISVTKCPIYCFETKITNSLKLFPSNLKAFIFQYLLSSGFLAITKYLGIFVNSNSSLDPRSRTSKTDSQIVIPNYLVFKMPRNESGSASAEMNTNNPVPIENWKFLRVLLQGAVNCSDSASQFHIVICQHLAHHGSSR